MSYITTLISCKPSAFRIKIDMDYNNNNNNNNNNSEVLLGTIIHRPNAPLASQERKESEN